MEGEENTALIELLPTFKQKGIKLFLISNSDEVLAAQQAKEHPFLAQFDKLYYSWQTGFAKPDPNAYKAVLDEQHLTPEDCVYFDDSERNVAAAKSLGIESYIFESPEQVQNKFI